MNDLKTDNPLALRLLMTDELYLVDARQEIPPPAEKKTADQAPEYLGDNNKFILILVTEKEYTKDFLNTFENILKARKLEIKDTAIVSLSKYPEADFGYLKQFFACTKMVLFGIDPAVIGLKNISGNEIVIHSNTRILATFTFDVMLKDEAKKRLFWTAFKQL
jgi:hypothetical protein